MWYREAQEGIEDTSTITEVPTHPVALFLMNDDDICFVSSQGKEERERKERKGQRKGQRNVGERRQREAEKQERVRERKEKDSSCMCVQ